MIVEISAKHIDDDICHPLLAPLVAVHVTPHMKQLRQEQ
jgi:hypothetical protein